eukprot:2391204-Prymnesium_polylepis.1
MPTARHGASSLQRPAPAARALCASPPTCARSRLESRDVRQNEVGAAASGQRPRPCAASQRPLSPHRRAERALRPSLRHCARLEPARSHPASTPGRAHPHTPGRCALTSRCGGWHSPGNRPARRPEAARADAATASSVLCLQSCLRSRMYSAPTPKCCCGPLPP